MTTPTLWEDDIFLCRLITPTLCGGYTYPFEDDSTNPIGMTTLPREEDDTHPVRMIRADDDTPALWDDVTLWGLVAPTLWHDNTYPALKTTQIAWGWQCLPRDDNDKVHDVPDVAQVGAGVKHEAQGQNLSNELNDERLWKLQDKYVHICIYTVPTTSKSDWSPYFQATTRYPPRPIDLRSKNLRRDLPRK